MENKIKSICDAYGIENWHINQETGLVDVNGYVNLSAMGLSRIPIKFGVVSGSFYCNYNKLTTLEGSPQSVGGNFDCRGNKLENMNYTPMYIMGEVKCDFPNFDYKSWVKSWVRNKKINELLDEI